MFKVAFPTGRDSATFQDEGKEVFSFSRDKGTTGQAQNLAMGQEGLGQSVKTYIGLSLDLFSFSYKIHRSLYSILQYVMIFLVLYIRFAVGF